MNACHRSNMLMGFKQHAPHAQVLLVACVLLANAGLYLSQPTSLQALPKLPHHNHEIPPGAAKYLPEKWRPDVEKLWDTYGKSAAFCLGDSANGVAKLLQQSFPYPLPTGPAHDLLCSNSATIAEHLCEPEEVLMYYEACEA
jgi:hypothetical protein